MADRPTRPEAEPSETEIEITPAMIEAGENAYYAVDQRFAEIKVLVQEIYEAMYLARHT